VTSILAGGFLVLASDWSITVFGSVYNNFHMIFAFSLLMRLIAAVYARTIREPDSHWTSQVVMKLVGVTPFRMLRFPVGLYRSFRPEELRGKPRKGNREGQQPEVAARTEPT